jgi:hypothetical protein
MKYRSRGHGWASIISLVLCCGFSRPCRDQIAVVVSPLNRESGGGRAAVPEYPHAAHHSPRPQGDGMLRLRHAEVLLVHQ